jgi:hypothetical protein
MKRPIYFIFFIILLGFTTAETYSQNCHKFHLYGACMQYPGPNYKIDGQSRSSVIGVGDKLLYNVIFYGDRNYKLFFCATDQLLPLHFIISDSETGEMIYDSKKDNNIETLELNIENTRRMMLEISVLGNHSENINAEDLLGCMGMLIYYRPIVSGNK